MNSFSVYNMTSLPSPQNASSSSTESPSSSHAQAPTPSSPKPLPSQPTPKLPHQDKTISLWQAFQADQALVNPFWSPDRPDLDPSVLFTKFKHTGRGTNRRSGVKNKRSTSVSGQPQKLRVNPFVPHSSTCTY